MSERTATTGAAVVKARAVGLLLTLTGATRQSTAVGAAGRAGRVGRQRGGEQALSQARDRASWRLSLQAGVRWVDEQHARLYPLRGGS